MSVRLDEVVPEVPAAFRRAVHPASADVAEAVAAGDIRWLRLLMADAHPDRGGIA